MWSLNLRAANLVISCVSRSDSACCRAHRLSIDGTKPGKQQCLYFLPLPQGQGSFLPIFSRAWRGITLPHYRASVCGSKNRTAVAGPAERTATLDGFFFRKEHCHAQISMYRARRAVYLQPLPAVVSDLSQTRAG